MKNIERKAVKGVAGEAERERENIRSLCKMTDHISIMRVDIYRHDHVCQQSSLFTIFIPHVSF